MKNNTLIWVLIGAVVLLGGYFLFATDNNPSPSTQSLLAASPTTNIVNQVQPSPITGNTYLSTTLLTEQNESGQSGTAIFSENEDGNVVVTINLVGPASTVPQPAHIHIGECPNPGAVKYPLTNVVDNKSETVLDTTWADLLTGEEKLAVNVHKSSAESSVYTSCGDISLAPSPSSMN